MKEERVGGSARAYRGGEGGSRALAEEQTPIVREARSEIHLLYVRTFLFSFNDTPFGRVGFCWSVRQQTRVPVAVSRVFLPG